MFVYWLASTVCFLFATFVALTGGVKGSYLGIPLSSRRSVTVGLIAWAFVVLAARTSDGVHLDERIAWIGSTVRRFAALIAAALAAATFLVAVFFGAFTAAGADPYGYVSQARLWAGGNPVQFQTELAMQAPWPNAARSFCPLGYTWLWQTYSPLIVLALCAPLLRPLRSDAVNAIAFMLVLGVCYVFYRPADHWTYLRFLLPGIPWLVIMFTAVIGSAAARWSPQIHATVLALQATVLGLSYLQGSVRGDAFAVKALFDDRYRIAAANAAAQTPPHSAIVCLLQSGSLRYYADRLTIRYDVIDAEWLARAVEYLARKGRLPYLALEATEVDGYAARFGAQAPLLRGGSRAVDAKGLVTLYGPDARTPVR